MRNMKDHRFVSEYLNDKNKFSLCIISLLVIAIFWGDAIGSVNFRILGVVVTFYRVIILSMFFVTLIYIYKKKTELLSCQIYVLIFIIIWIFLAVFQLMFFENLNTLSAIKEITYLLFGGLIIFYFFIYVDNYKNLKKIYKLLKYIGFVLIIGGIIEMVTGVHWPISRYSDAILIQKEIELWGGSEDIYRWISTGPFYNENDFSAALAILFPFFFYENTDLKMKVLSFVGQIGGVILLFLNNSMIAFLSILLFFSIKIYLYSPSKLRIIEIVSGISGCCFILLNWSIMVDFLSRSSFAIRLEVYSQSFKLCKNHMLLGIGPGGFEEYFTKNSMNTGMVRVINPHNYFFEIWSQYGIIILIGFLLILVWLFKEYCKVSKYREAQIFIEVLIIFVIVSFAPSSFLDKGFSWVPIAIGVPGVIILNRKYKL